jgi:hypothetical protein
MRVARESDGAGRIGPRNAKSGEPEGLPDLAGAAYADSGGRVKRGEHEMFAKSADLVFAAPLLQAPALACFAVPEAFDR